MTDEQKRALTFVLGYVDSSEACAPYKWVLHDMLAAGASEGQAVPPFSISLDDVIAMWNATKADSFEDELMEFAVAAINFYKDTAPDPRDAEIAALRERIAGMEKDAEDAARYRWLEGHAKCDPKMGGNHHWWGINLRGVHGPTLAIGIDAAIAKEMQ